MASERAQTPDRILESAATLFYERGFASVGVDDIGAAAGISGPAIYRHFASKDEILAALFHVAIDRLLVLCGELPEDPAAALDALIRAQTRWVLEEHVLNGIYAREDRSLSEPFRRQVHQRARDHLRRWERVIAACYPERSARTVEMNAHAAIGLLLSTAWWPADVRGREELAERLPAMVHAALACELP